MKKATTPSDKTLRADIQSFNLKRQLPVIYIVLIGFLAGVLWLTAMRFFLVQPKETHYHANFAVYIDGEREQFSDISYYEEVAACTVAYENEPKGRVHMHNEVNDVIHVHDMRVTYADFFHNLFWTVGDEVLETKDAVYQTNDTKKLSYILNGQEVDRIDTRVIGNLDKLLISYDDASADVAAQYATVTDTAEEVNKYQDPATCAGLNGPGHDSFLNRLKRATFWNQ